MNQNNNSLHTKEQCPKCNHVFIAGFDAGKNRMCPACKHRFVSGQKSNNCNTAVNRYSGSNNIYYKDGCPAIMSDGRFITYYNSSNELTEAMRKLNGFQSGNQFRNFMQKNGKQFMDAERNHILNENTCQPAVACSEGWHDLWNKYGGDWTQQ